MIVLGIASNQAGNSKGDAMRYNYFYTIPSLFDNYTLNHQCLTLVVMSANVLGEVSFIRELDF